MKTNTEHVFAGRSNRSSQELGAMDKGSTPRTHSARGDPSGNHEAAIAHKYNGKHSTRAASARGAANNFDAALAHKYQGKQLRLKPPASATPSRTASAPSDHSSRATTASSHASRSSQPVQDRGRSGGKQKLSQEHGHKDTPGDEGPQPLGRIPEEDSKDTRFEDEQGDVFNNGVFRHIGEAYPQQHARQAAAEREKKHVLFAQPSVAPLNLAALPPRRTHKKDGLTPRHASKKVPTLWMPGQGDVCLHVCVNVCACVISIYVFMFACVPNTAPLDTHTRTRGTGRTPRAREGVAGDEFEDLVALQRAQRAGAPAYRSHSGAVTARGKLCARAHTYTQQTQTHTHCLTHTISVNDYAPHIHVHEI